MEAAVLNSSKAALLYFVYCYYRDDRTGWSRVADMDAAEMIGTHATYLKELRRILERAGWIILRPGHPPRVLPIKGYEVDLVSRGILTGDLQQGFSLRNEPAAALRKSTLPLNLSSLSLNGSTLEEAPPSANPDLSLNHSSIRGRVLGRPPELSLNGSTKKSDSEDSRELTLNHSRITSKGSTKAHEKNIYGGNKANREKKSSSWAERPVDWSDPVWMALVTVTRSPDTPARLRGTQFLQMAQEWRMLKHAGVSKAEVERVGRYWFTCKLAGKQDVPPKPKEVRENLEAARVWEEQLAAPAVRQKVDQVAAARREFESKLNRFLTHTPATDSLRRESAIAALERVATFTKVEEFTSLQGELFDAGIEL